MAPLHTMLFMFLHVSFVIHGSGTYSSHLKGLAVRDAGFAVRWMTTVLVKVLVGVVWLGIKIRYQVLPVWYDFGVQELYTLPRTLGGEIDCRMV